MATKTDESVTGQKYTRQRSNSDPQPNLEEVKSSLSDRGNHHNKSVRNHCQTKGKCPHPGR